MKGGRWKGVMLTQQGDRGVGLWVSPSAVQPLVLGGWDGFVGLARGPVHGLHPQNPVLLIIAGKHHQVPLSHRAEEHLSTLET